MTARPTNAPTIENRSLRRFIDSILSTIRRPVTGTPYDAAPNAWKDAQGNQVHADDARYFTVTLQTNGNGTAAHASVSPVGTRCVAAEGPVDLRVLKALLNTGEAGGNMIYTGDGPPPSSLGSNGDFYIERVTGDYYEKAFELWGVVANLKGPPGVDGSNGVDGVDGVDGTAHVATLAEASTSGSSVVYVDSVRDFFAYRESSTRTVDGIEVLSTLIGAGRLERLNIPHPSWLYNGVFYIDPTNGNDEASGLQASPIKTAREFLRRVGENFTLKATLDVFIVGDLPAEDSFVFAARTDSTKRLNVSGVPTLIWEGIASAVTNMAAASNQATEATLETSAGIAWDPSGSVGNHFVHNVTRNLWSTIAKNLGSGKVRLSTWIGVNQTGQASAVAGNAQVNDVLRVYRMPKVENFGAILTGRSNSTLGGGVVVQNIEFIGRCFLQSEMVAYVQNTIIGGTGLFIGGTGQVVLSNCIYSYQTIGNGEIFLRLCAGLVKSAILNSAGSRPRYEFRNGVLFQGVGLTVASFSPVAVVDDGLCFFDCANPIQCQRGIEITAYADAKIWGAGNTGTLFQLGAGCKAVLSTLAGVTIAQNSGNPIGLPSRNTAPAFNPLTNTYTTNRALTWANIAAAVSAGGFGGHMFDPATGVYIGLQTVPAGA